MRCFLFKDNTEEIIMNVINADLEGRKLAPGASLPHFLFAPLFWINPFSLCIIYHCVNSEEWIEEEVKSKVYSPGPRSLRPYQPPPPDPEDQYRRQVQNLVDMGPSDPSPGLTVILSDGIIIYVNRLLGSWSCFDGDHLCWRRPCCCHCDSHWSCKCQPL